MAAVAVVWAVAKLMSVLAWVLVTGEYGDTYYYFLSAEAAAARGGGVRDTMQEYPTPAGLLLLLPYEWGATTYQSYRGAVMAMTTLADAAFALLLGRRLGPAGVLAWVGLTIALGQLALLRFDMLPAVAAGAAVLLAIEGRRGAAAVLVGLGTGLKLWPILLSPLALGEPAKAGDRRRLGLAPAGVLGLALTGAALVAVSVVTGGWDRLISPLGYQRDRGLQIEAVAATLPMRDWASDPAYRVFFSPFKAFEVTGPSVAGWLGIAQGASVVGALVCLALLAWWWWRDANPAAIAWLALAFVGVFVITSKALSPQYLLWLAAPAAVLFGVAWRRWRGAPGAGRGRGHMVVGARLVRSHIGDLSGVLRRTTRPG